MSRNLALIIMTSIVLVGVLGRVLELQKVKASGTIYIRANGLVDPSTAPIQRDGNLYTFTGNLFDEIVIERDNILVDGAGYTVQGTGSGTGIALSGRSNVAIKNMEIRAFTYGVLLTHSSSNSITGNEITNNTVGMKLEALSDNNNVYGNRITNNIYGITLQGSCSHNNVSRNKIEKNDIGIDLFGSCNYNNVSRNSIANNNYTGIVLYDSSNNYISENNITTNAEGIKLDSSLNNSISNNNITDNDYAGILLWYLSDNNSVHGNNITNNNHGIDLADSINNSIYHNNFINNTKQVYDYAWDHPETLPSKNIWDDGYPSGGNYWSDYEERYPNATEIDDSGLWDTPYVIDADNQDNYPIIPEFPSFLILPLFTMTTIVAVMVCRRKH